ncbi:MAG: UTP--glucose-1-phosphate uridylyltransferase [Spirochaetes bacterium]|nr:UTP--glucose-1-phosphate uridylyltransferase [Spirochaetota bacterium]
MKGIIIAAGYGTRFLPCTKTIPKEMFPLIDTPAIDFIIEEFILSGIKDILIVTSRRKKVLEDYLDREIELENIFKKENQTDKLIKIKEKDANFYFIRQKEMLGTGHAILICKEFIQNDPFIVAYPDDLVFSDIPLSKQLINVHNITKGSVLALLEIGTDVSRYGVVDYKTENNIIKINKIIEKPPKGKEPSNIISVGRYLFTAEIITLLEKNFKKHAKGEFYHIDAINTICSEGRMYGCKFSGERLDIGDKAGYFEGIIKYALSRKDLKEEAINILKKYINF